MRTYRTSQHQTSGTNEADNTQIVSEMYEVFAKENARAASQANYQEGKSLNENTILIATVTGLIIIQIITINAMKPMRH